MVAPPGNLNPWSLKHIVGFKEQPCPPRRNGPWETTMSLGEKGF